MRIGGTTVRYSVSELVWIFLTVSFLGWILETVYAAVKQKRFVNRGLVNGPLCIIYGIVSIMNAVFLQELSIWWVFIGSMILATVIEWSAGHILERIGQGKWWDYSNVKWNLDGYICIPASLLWGILGMLGVSWGNDSLVNLFYLIPETIRSILLWISMGILVVDIVATMIILSGKSRNLQKWREIDNWFISSTAKLEMWVQVRVNRRIEAAHAWRRRTASKEHAVGFAYGCSFYKVVLLFVIGSLLGDVVETIFCRINAGVWMSRSSLVWGPFSIVWGFAIAAVTVLLYRYRNYSDRFLFLMGTVLGGVYEYLCSVFTELVFGMVFWDYSEIPFNLGGRINLLYCIFWGFAAVIWFKALYPMISRWIEKIHPRIGRFITWCLIVFMCVNMAVSAMALLRHKERSMGIEGDKSWQQVMDEKFDDTKLQKIYPNMIRIKGTT